MKYKIKKPSSTKKPIATIVALVVVLLLFGALIYRYWTTARTDKQTDSADNGSLDLSPPTEEEKAETEQHKENLSEQQNPAPVDGKAKVVPVITSATKAEVRAYVTGVVEEGGTCTATAVQGDQVKTASSTGFDNVSSTQCAPIVVDLGAGTWSVTVSYDSPKAQGTSQPAEVR